MTPRAKAYSALLRAVEAQPGLSAGRYIGRCPWSDARTYCTVGSLIPQLGVATLERFSVSHAMRAILGYKRPSSLDEEDYVARMMEWRDVETAVTATIRENDAFNVNADLGFDNTPPGRAARKAHMVAWLLDRIAEERAREGDKSPAAEPEPQAVLA